MFSERKNPSKIYNYFINLTEEDISQEFALTRIKETNNYFTKEIDQNELMSNENKFFTSVFEVTVYISISDFASLVDISMGIIQLYWNCTAILSWIA